MDSRKETYDHIENVRKFLRIFETELERRAYDHDGSKLESPELEIFNEFTPKLKETTYMSEEYKQYLRQMEPALIHHYKVNRHHPEHFEGGIKQMTLIDLLECLCDWKAASMRHADGDVFKSIELNQKRFGYSDELKNILKETLLMLD